MQRFGRAAVAPPRLARRQRRRLRGGAVVHRARLVREQLHAAARARRREAAQRCQKVVCARFNLGPQRAHRAAAVQQQKELRGGERRHGRRRRRLLRLRLLQAPGRGVGRGPCCGAARDGRSGGKAAAPCSRAGLGARIARRRGRAIAPPRRRRRRRAGRGSRGRSGAVLNQPGLGSRRAALARHANVRAQHGAVARQHAGGSAAVRVEAGCEVLVARAAHKRLRQPRRRRCAPRHRGGAAAGAQTRGGSRRARHACGNAARK